MDFPYEEGLIERTLICVIVLPMIALMKNQSTLFTAKGISATHVHVSDKESTDKETRRKIVKGECQFGVIILHKSVFLVKKFSLKKGK